MDKILAGVEKMERSRQRHKMVGQQRQKQQQYLF